MADTTSDPSTIADAVAAEVDAVQDREGTAPAGSAGPLEAGDKWGGIIKETLQNASKSQNSVWNASDYTGNSAIDATLDSFAEANANNPGALTALESVAVSVRVHPEKFVNPDGTVNKEALTNEITMQLAGVSSIVVPHRTNADSGPQAGEEPCLEGPTAQVLEIMVADVVVRCKVGTDVAYVAALVCALAESRGSC
jgi:hypothetical protein